VSFTPLSYSRGATIYWRTILTSRWNAYRNPDRTRQNSRVSGRAATCEGLHVMACAHVTLCGARSGLVSDLAACVCAYHNGVLQMLHGTRLPLCSNGVVCNHDVKHCSFFSGRAHGLYQFSCIVEILSPSCLCISACLADAPVLQRCILAVSRRVAACS
jgi:hypothetical protein